MRMSCLSLLRNLLMPVMATLLSFGLIACGVCDSNGDEAKETDAADAGPEIKKDKKKRAAKPTPKANTVKTCAAVSSAKGAAQAIGQNAVSASSDFTASDILDQAP